MLSLSFSQLSIWQSFGQGARIVPLCDACQEPLRRHLFTAQEPRVFGSLRGLDLCFTRVSRAWFVSSGAQSVRQYILMRDAGKSWPLRVQWVVAGVLIRHCACPDDHTDTVSNTWVRAKPQRHQFEMCCKPGPHADRITWGSTRRNRTLLLSSTGKQRRAVTRGCTWRRIDRCTAAFAMT